MADEVTPLRKAQDPITDSSGGFSAPILEAGLGFHDIGSYGLRQYGGWVREEILPELVGREGARTYREMMDNSSIIGAMLFTISQSMRKVEWRIAAPDERPEAEKEIEFVESLRHDMSHTWDDFIAEVLSMLPFGYSAHEIVYKRRLGPNPPTAKRKLWDGSEVEIPQPSSEYADGRIGWRRLPVRGQETILKWFFDRNGQIKGLTQQPWVGSLIDIPIEKMLLFRPTQHKNNPEGRSILRNAYRDYYFVKRLEELEAILFERMGGFPVMYVPNKLLELASSAANTAEVTAAKASVDIYKRMVGRIRIDEQMGAVLPSDPYRDGEGKFSNVRMYEFALVTPQHGRQTVDPDKTIERHSVQMLMTMLADFIKLGHEVRGTNNLAVTRVDMFYAAIEGWLHAVSGVINRYALPRLWAVNALPVETMPILEPDMPQRLDLDSLGNFIKNIAGSGMPLFPDEELESFIRDAAGFPDVESPDASEAVQRGRMNGPQLVTQIRGAVAKAILDMRKLQR